MKISFTKTVYAVFMAGALLSALIAAGGCAKHEPKRKGLPEAELSRLDDLLQDSRDYDARRTHRIDSLKLKLDNTPGDDLAERYRLSLDIAGRYRSFCSDSSIMFYARAYDIGKQLYRFPVG